VPFIVSKEPPIYIFRVEVNSALKMKAGSSSKIFMVNYKTVHYHNPENYNLICELMLLREMLDYFA
jgi:hypothetical protein